MNGSIFSPSSHIVLLSQLVKRLDTLGIEVPPDLLAEAKMTDTLRMSQNKNNATRQAALLKLRNAPITEFQSQLESAQDTWDNTAQVDQALFDEQVEIIRYQRLSERLRTASEGIYKGLADRMNKVIHQFDLNTHRLPYNLTDNFDFMRSSAEDMAAINAYRSAAPVLDSYWNAYQSVAKEMGLDLTVGDVDELSQGLDVAFLLGAVDSIYTAMNIEKGMRTAKQGLDSMKLVAPIAPWAVFSLEGVKLDVKTPQEARAIREIVQQRDWGN